MTNTFRLTKAEFKKIFKRPSVFIMALLLIATIFVSIYVFNPVEKTDYTIDYGENNTAYDYYTTFFNDDAINTKMGIDLTFTEVDNIINYYTEYNTRATNLVGYYNDILIKFQALKSENSPVLKEQRYTEFKNSLNIFKQAYLSFETLKTIDGKYYEHIEYTTNNTAYSVASALELNRLIEKTNIESAHEIVNTFEINNYSHELKVVLNNGLNFIETTFKNISKDISDMYNEYDALILQGASKLSSIEITRKSLVNYLITFKDYFELVLSRDYPIILTYEEDKNSFVALLEESLAILDFNFEAQNSYSSHKKARDNLLTITLSNSVKGFANDIVQVHVSKTLIDDFKSIQTITNQNKTNLLATIESFMQDESIKNIQNHITEYSLLAQSYNSYINDTTILYVVSGYDKSEFSKFAGYGLDKFNLYEFKERITTNNYYISNNIYSNSFMSNFAFNQKIDTNGTNLYDFVYFAMELCTIIIIIFAMMLICNLVTGETESGTIKLLLVRPYRRSKIITAKLMATLFFVITFMIFSAVITYVGGYFMFGDVTTNILAVFNATTPFVISPLLLMLVNILTLTLDVIFFVIVALMISVIIKNYAGSISCVIVILIINYAMNLLFGGMFWYTLLPGMNLHLFKYFGSAFTSVATPTIFQSILITSIESSMNIVFSGLINIAYLVISIAVAYSVFAKRDF